MLVRSRNSSSISFSILSPPYLQRWPPRTRFSISVFPSFPSLFARSCPPHTSVSAYSSSSGNCEASPGSEPAEQFSSKNGPLKPGLYLVGTPIGNLEDITLRALRVLKSANVILSEDTRHSGKLLHHYNIKTPLISYHKFNESQREQSVLRRLQDGEIVALISDAGTPGISDPGMDLAKLCADKDIPVIPIPGPSAVVAALSASGLPTNEFTFVGFLPKHSGTRRERLIVSASSAATQTYLDNRRCVIAREMTKLHEQFWRGTIEEAKEAFAIHQPKGEITLMIEGVVINEREEITDAQLENKLGELISKGQSLSTAVKLVAAATSMKKKDVYSLALEKFGNLDSAYKNESIHPGTT